MFSRTLLRPSVQRSIRAFSTAEGYLDDFTVNEAELAGVIVSQPSEFETREGEKRASFILKITSPAAKNQISYRIVIANPNVVPFVLSLPVNSNVYVNGTMKYRKKEEKVFKEVEVTNQFKLIERGTDALGSGEAQTEFENEDKLE
eukprot:TRINITY_DN1856_c0_g1_i1.p1 TRINITY_DN1856_c0_g1~~TRINITY_DN1856_c0_g1_i1.p1  ORF type:complete len:146 (+),score=33.38 TRINITY_DN1856_c0_g1_i1:60-497(+)